MFYEKNPAMTPAEELEIYLGRIREKVKGNTLSGKYKKLIEHLKNEGITLKNGRFLTDKTLLEESGFSYVEDFFREMTGVKDCLLSRFEMSCDSQELIKYASSFNDSHLNSILKEHVPTAISLICTVESKSETLNYYNFIRYAEIRRIVSYLDFLEHNEDEDEWD